MGEREWPGCVERLKRKLEVGCAVLATAPEAPAFWKRSDVLQTVEEWLATLRPIAEVRAEAARAERERCAARAGNVAAECAGRGDCNGKCEAAIRAMTPTSNDHDD